MAGELSSDDDFYMLDSGLVVLQTTNDILNASLYTALDNRTVVSWQRVSQLMGSWDWCQSVHRLPLVV